MKKVYKPKKSSTTTPFVNNIFRKQSIAEIITEDKSPKKCQAGSIRKSAYIRSSYKYEDHPEKIIEIKEAIVPATCMKIKNNEKKERVRIIVDDPKLKELGKYGYSDLKHKKAIERHDALDKVYLNLEIKIGYPYLI